MRILIHTVASDTDFGTETRIFTTEEEAFRDIYERTIGSGSPTFEEFMEDPYEVIQEHKSYLDTYSADAIEINIPITKVISDAIRLHPWAQAVAQRYRLARGFFRREHHPDPAR
ncbi:hypothetical protein JYP52_01255 [Nitratireductor aquibiodomus]|uniref:hypothetical protein n=1 Tax=Nitratireductor aquibiodomus TaxID=204799 RepID=UPI0019D3F280|nr:hypothetical protein [Nitratireductor aquibiodomus]MBN7759749.1 hypothetical protein [Nitratireductor aquibiodomus]